MPIVYQTSRSNDQHSNFIVERSRVLISARRPAILAASIRILLSNRQRLLSSISFPITRPNNSSHPKLYSLWSWKSRLKRPRNKYLVPYTWVRCAAPSWQLSQLATLPLCLSIAPCGTVWNVRQSPPILDITTVGLTTVQRRHWQGAAWGKQSFSTWMWR
jgi:hypothetical protein